MANQCKTPRRLLLAPTVVIFAPTILLLSVPAAVPPASVLGAELGG
jgi:hypothetical protein